MAQQGPIRLPFDRSPFSPILAVVSAVRCAPRSACQPRRAKGENVTKKISARDNRERERESEKQPSSLNFHQEMAGGRTEGHDDDVVPFQSFKNRVREVRCRRSLSGQPQMHTDNSSSSTRRRQLYLRAVSPQSKIVTQPEQRSAPVCVCSSGRPFFVCWVGRCRSNVPSKRRTSRGRSPFYTKG